MLPQWLLEVTSILKDLFVAVLGRPAPPPGFELRARALREMAALLVPGGCVILSTWQFLDSPRLQRKIVDWSEAGIASEALEPGDYLLDWRRGGRGLRYVHLVDEVEWRDWRRQAGCVFARPSAPAGARET